MTLDLTGVYAKLDRANEHLEALEQETVKFMQRKPYGLGKKPENEGRRHIGTLSVYRQPGPSFGILIGDIASNLRAALDHLVFAVARDALDSVTLEKRADDFMFPICSDLKYWPGAEARRLNGIPDVVRAEFERHQPYRTHDPAQEAPLWAVHWLNNRDKHRLLHTVGGYVQAAGGHITGKFRPEDIVDQEFAASPLSEDGAQVVRIDFAKPVMSVDMDFQMVLQIFIRDISATRDIREFLDEAGQHVQRIVANVGKMDWPRDSTSHLS